MEHGASERVEEQSYTEVTVKIEVDMAAQSTACRGVQTNANFTEEEPGLAELVKSEPALLVKEEVVEDGWQHFVELQCVQGPSTSAIVGSTNVFDSIGDLDNKLDIKEKLGDMDIVPTALQHTDTQGTTKQKDMSSVEQERTINQDIIDPILCGGVTEESIEDQWRGAHSQLYRCGQCVKTFNSKKRLTAHCRKVHGKESHKCTICDKEYKCRTYLSRHVLLVHSGQRECADKSVGAHSQLLKCDQCLKTFNSKISLTAHCKKVHVKESHKCTKCDKEFTCRTYLLKHVRRVHSGKRYECAVCMKVYNYKVALVMHMKSLHAHKSVGPEPRIYSCDYCKKMFKNKLQVRRHTAKVHTSRSYKCHQCYKNFKCKTYLMKHTAKIHTAEPPIYNCDYCKKTFTDKGILRDHVGQVHSSGSYKCHQCNKIFTCKAYLMKHKTNVHAAKVHTADSRTHTCDYCQKRFCTKSGLRLHTKNIHVAAHIHRCRRCNENFKSSDELQRHNTSIHRKGQHECEVCLRRYMSKATLRKHIKKAHNSEGSRPTADDTDAAATTSKQQHNVDVVKEEPADGQLELGPVVFQHTDCNYRPYEGEPQDGSGD